MSFVPAPQQASASSANNASSAVVPAVTPTPEGGAGGSDWDLIFKIRTFDVFWVEKNALMNRDGYAKVCCLLE
jgi:hypothetical protein